jgi:hypothetical protein
MIDSPSFCIVNVARILAEKAYFIQYYKIDSLLFNAEKTGDLELKATLINYLLPEK